MFDTLRVLVENAGRLVTKQELLDTVWPETAVEENNLNHNVSVLRKALGEKATGQQFIETVPRVGYRFAAAVERAEPRDGSAVAASAEAASGNPVLHHERRRPARVCQYRQRTAAGEGIELADASRLRVGQPDLAALVVRALTASPRVRYDERGNGMSQRDVADVSFDTWVRDLETVVDAAGLDRFPLLGISRGGPIAIAYAVKHPERVSHLVLYGTFRRGIAAHRKPDQLEARRALASLMRLGWGLNNPAFCRMFTCRFIPRSHAGARTLVRRAAARVHVAGKRRAADGHRRRHRCASAPASQ